MDEYRGTRPDKVINVNMFADPMIKWFEASSKGAREIGEEWTRFINERTRRNIDALGQVCQCGTPDRLAELQERWVSDWIHDVTDESNRILNLTGNLMRDYLQRVENRTE